MPSYNYYDHQDELNHPGYIFPEYDESRNVLPILKEEFDRDAAEQEILDSAYNARIDLNNVSKGLPRGNASFAGVGSYAKPYLANVEGRPVKVIPGSRMLESSPYDVTAFYENFAKPIKKYNEDQRAQDFLYARYMSAKSRGLVGPEIKAEDPNQDYVITDYWQNGDTGKILRGIDRVLMGENNTPDGSYKKGLFPTPFYFIPGIGNAIAVGTTVKDIADGTRNPGILDMAIIGGVLRPALNGASYAINKVLGNASKGATKMLSGPKYINSEDMKWFNPDGTPYSWREHADLVKKNGFPSTIQGAPVIDVEAILGGSATR